MLRPSLLASLAVACVAFAFSSSARAEAIRYRGMHPLWPHGGEFCYIDLPHIHAVEPPDRRVYRELPGGEFLFIGDAVALGYQGPKVAYFGPHPFAMPGTPAGDKVFCYIAGPHYHIHKPVPATSFVQKDGVYWYTGEFPPQFEDESYFAYINGSGSVPTYQPPKIDIGSAPPGYHLPAFLAARASKPPEPPPTKAAPEKVKGRKP